MKISLILNLALLAGLFFVLGRPNQRAAASTAPPTITADMSALPAVISAPPSRLPAEPTPFRWNQLDAKDYHVYVKNLRAIGCPEATVRAIVAADVHAAYLVRIQAIEKNLSDLNNSSWSVQVAAFKTEEEMKEELQKVPDEEAAEIADLLGLKPAPVQVAADTGSRRNQPSQRDVLVSPLVLQDIDLSALNLSEDQKQAIAGIRQDFLQQVGGMNQDPNDSAYVARWQQAQPAADNLLQAYLGNDAYTQYQLMTSQKSLEEQYAQPQR